jgi:hypothetical protein
MQSEPAHIAMLLEWLPGTANSDDRCDEPTCARLATLRFQCRIVEPRFEPGAPGDEREEVLTCCRLHALTFAALLMGEFLQVVPFGEN